MQIKLFVALEIQYFELRIFSFNSHVYYIIRVFTVSTCAFILLTRAFNLTARAFNLPTRTFSLLTRGLELVTCGFELVTRRFELVTRRFELVARRFELVTRRFELVTRRFELVTRGFQLVTRGFQLVTRVLLFHSYGQLKRKFLILFHNAKLKQNTSKKAQKMLKPVETTQLTFTCSKTTKNRRQRQ